MIFKLWRREELMQVAMSNAEVLMTPWWGSGVVRLGFDESIGTFVESFCSSYCFL
jgi:hypothetical protein